MPVTVVTGATGHLGANLVRTLCAEGRRTRALVRDDARALEGLEVERVPGDVTSADSLARAFEGAEIVHHLAARISIVRHDAALVRQVNVGGTRNVIDACRRAGVRRLVHYSSIHALSDTPADAPIDEDRALAGGPGVPAYDRSKADAERLVRDAVAEGLDAVVVIPTAVLGPHDHKPSRMGQVLRGLYRGTLPGLVEGGYDWVDARDVVAGALRAEADAPAGARYLLSGRWRSVREVAEIVHQAGGARPPRLVSPMWLARAFAPAAETFARLTRREPLYTPDSLRALRCHRHIRHDRAARDLDHRPRPLEQTIGDTLAWMRSAGVL